MKKTCNYCRAYEAGMGKGDYGNCMLGYNQDKLSESELSKYNILPYGLVDVRYYIAMKPAEECTSPKTYKELWKQVEKIV